MRGMMSAREYREAIKEVGLSQVGAADFFWVNPKTSRRWADARPDRNLDVPRAVEIVLRLMLLHKLTAQDVQARFPGSFAPRSRS